MEQRVHKLKKQLLFVLVAFLYFSNIGYADMPEFFDQPDSGYASNVVTDIISHDGAIWFATDKGLNFSNDGGQTWFLYDNTNGLVTSSISAFFSVPRLGGQRIWAATNHTENINENNLAISDGVSFSDDNGLTWTQVNFESAPNDIPFVWGGDRTVFDITGHYDPANPELDNWLFFTAFAGGFLASRDGGQSFRRIFPSVLDSLQFHTPNSQPSLRNRYFSCVTDTSHGDSLFVWAGTAGGLFQYVFVEPKDKAFAKHINAMELRADSSSVDSSFVFIGGYEGFTRGNTQDNQFISRFESNGLPGGQVTAILDFGGKLFVGTAESATDHTSTGLAVSTNFGDTFSAFLGSNSSDFIGGGNQISDFAVMNDRIYMAVETNGLYVSTDTGLTWTSIDVDPSNTAPANQRNIVHAIEAVGDTLNVGTDSGFVRLYLSLSGTVDSSLQYVFPEDSTSSTKVISVNTQTFGVDSAWIWTVNIPIDTVLNLTTPIVAFSRDGGLTFPNFFNLNAFSTDVDFLGDTAIIIGDNGALFTDNGVIPSERFLIYEKFITAIDTTLNDTTFVIVDSLHADSLKTISIKGDTILVGGNRGFALSIDRGFSFNITRINNDSLTADFVLNHTSAISGLDGDWFPGLAVQHESSDTAFARIWASVRPTFSGAPGISVGVQLKVIAKIDTLLNDTTFRFDRQWGTVHDQFAWNFAFASDTIFASTDDGLIFAHTDSLIDGSDTYQWTTLEILDTLGAPLLLPGTPVFAVEVDSLYIWAGTGDRTIRLNRSDLSVSRAFYVVDPVDEVYAFPIPFSHANSNALDFHFKVNQQADITIEIYDFAMQLVKRVIDNATYAPGVYPTVGTERRIWDGRNGKGEEVSVGMYYFKIMYSTGDTRWGKIAIIP